VRAGYLDRAPGLIATISAVLGLLALIDALLPRERERVHTLTLIIPIPATETAAAITAVSGLLLLRVAAALRKRKRRAWRLATTVTAVLALGSVLRGGHRIGESVIALLLLLLLISARSRFTAKSDPATRWFTVRVVSQLLAAALVFGMAMLYLNPHRVEGHPSFWSRLREVADGLVGASGPVRMRGERFDAVLHGSLLGIGLLTAVTAALLMLRPPEPIARLSPEAEQRLRALLARYGARDSLGYFATRRDKSVVWSATGKAAISYRVVQGVALASGDPIGDPEAWPGAMTAYLAAGPGVRLDAGRHRLQRTRRHRVQTRTRPVRARIR
jgi:lysyl-tRNA synthetase class 2